MNQPVAAAFCLEKKCLLAASVGNRLRCLGKGIKAGRWVLASAFAAGPALIATVEKN
jgi:hypothetical protein